MSANCLLTCCQLPCFGGFYAGSKTPGAGSGAKYQEQSIRSRASGAGHQEQGIRSRVSGAEYQEITKTRVLLVFTIAIAQRNNKEIRYAGYEKPIDKGV